MLKEDPSAKHELAYKNLLALGLIHISYRSATFYEDTKQATDLVVVLPEEKEITVGLRTRKLNKYRKNFTLRARSSSGGKTEIHKWEEGIRPKYYITGWETEEGQLESAILIDVEKFYNSWAFKRLKKNFRLNKDKTGFCFCDLSDLFKVNCIIATIGFE